MDKGLQQMDLCVILDSPTGIIDKHRQHVGKHVILLERFPQNEPDYWGMMVPYWRVSGVPEGLRVFEGLLQKIQPPEADVKSLDSRELVVVG
jgi:hypothetical protein